MGWLTSHLKAHALIFDRKAASRYDAAAGLRLLIVFVLLERVIGPRATLRDRYAMFAAVFAVGLFFGILFHRSGNLAIVATFHGIGDVFLTGLP